MGRDSRRHPLAGPPAGSPRRGRVAGRGGGGTCPRRARAHRARRGRVALAPEASRVGLERTLPRPHPGRAPSPRPRAGGPGGLRRLPPAGRDGNRAQRRRRAPRRRHPARRLRARRDPLHGPLRLGVRGARHRGRPRGRRGVARGGARAGLGTCARARRHPLVRGRRGAGPARRRALRRAPSPQRARGRGGQPGGARQRGTEPHVRDRAAEPLGGGELRGRVPRSERVLGLRRGLPAHAQRHRLHGVEGARRAGPELRLHRWSDLLPHPARRHREPVAALAAASLHQRARRGPRARSGAIPRRSGLRAHRATRSSSTSGGVSSRG